MSSASRFLLTLAEYAAYLSVFAYMYFQEKATLLDYFYLAVLMIAVGLSFYNQGFDRQWYNNKLCYWLGKYSFSVFVCHYFYAVSLNRLLPEYSTKMRVVIYGLLTLSTALAVMLLCDMFRKHLKKLAKVKKILLN